MAQEIQCKYCDKKFERQIYGNYSVRCPYCYRLLEHVSDFGFGPVTPFYISIGSEVIGIVENKNNIYYLNFQGHHIKLKETYFNAVNEADKYVVDKLHISIKSVDLNIITECGSLWFFGEPFGRPYDNLHRIKSIDYDGEILVIKFKQGEELLIYNPVNITSNKNELKIEKATKIKWFYIPYGNFTQQRTITYTYEKDEIIKYSEYSLKGQLISADNSPAVLMSGY